MINVRTQGHNCDTKNKPIISRMQALSSEDCDTFWWHKPYLSFWLWLEKYLVTIDPNFGTLFPPNFVPWLLTHFAGNNIDISVLQADAAQIRKCCDSLESGMSTSMYFFCEFCLISSDTMMWNISDGEPSTWIKSIKIHKKSRQSLGQQIWRKTLFTSIQSVRPRSEIWMAWVHWYRGMGYNRNHHQVLDLQSLYLHMI